MKTKPQGSVRLSITFVVFVLPVCSHGPGIRMLMSHFLCHTWAHQGGLTTPTEWSQDICLTKHTVFGLKFLPNVGSQQMALFPSSLLLGSPALWKRHFSQMAEADVVVSWPWLHLAPSGVSVPLHTSPHCSGLACIPHLFELHPGLSVFTITGSKRQCGATGGTLCGLGTE